MDLDKTTVARRQLGTSLSLFMQDLDPVSVHTLALAGCEIAEHLTRKAGALSFSRHMLGTFPDLDMGEIRRLQRMYYNAFKHSTGHDGKDRADEWLLDRFDDEMNNHALFIGWHDYLLATGNLPVEAQVFQVWYFALYPEKLNPSVDTRPHKRLFPDLKAKSRSARKTGLREVIAQYVGNEELLRDPATDRRPLILSAD
jgi:hypothetical protein